ncbi:MAG: DUF2384 domain-containing protein [Gammaproteobacteria bacterium]|nr:MAG: DUF2384 domain-containing protein [Gammaproteobacteria bacterium]
MQLKKAIFTKLGGEKTFGAPIKTELELTEAVRQGLPVRVVGLVFDGLRLTTGDMEHLVMPRRTLQRRIKHHQRLEPDESGRMVRVARVLTFADEVFGNPEKASRWLHKPKRNLNGQTPIEVLDTEEGARIIEDRLFAIAHGLTA